MPESILKTLRTIVQAVNASADLAQALQTLVVEVKRAMQADVCSVYLREPESDDLLLFASDGLARKAVGTVRLSADASLVGLVVRRAEPLNLDDARSHTAYQAVLGTGEDSFRAFLGVPIIQYGRSLGVLVVRRRVARRFADDKLSFMVTLAAQLAGAIAHAQVSGEFARLLPGAASAGAAPALRLQGVSGSIGVGIGIAWVVYTPASLEAVPNREVGDVAQQAASLHEAVAAVRRDIQTYSARMVDVLPAEERALFDVYLLLLAEEGLVSDMVRYIEQGLWAPAAVREAILPRVHAFESMDDPYLRERAADIRDLGRRILSHLQSDHPPSPPPQGPVILVGEDVSATQVAEIQPGMLAGIVSSRGSGFSHAAILARSLGIPAVMGVGALPAVPLDGSQLIVDGYTATAFVDPNRALLEEFRRLLREERELDASLQELATEPAATLDGVGIELLANGGLMSDIGPALRNGADGVGLYRTEVPFLSRDRFPGEDEQVAIYRHVLEAFAPAPVTLRTLDIGGDKPLPYFPIVDENPFLGWRGIRISLDHPEIFLVQLRAMLRADAGIGNLRVLLPMISNVSQADAALALFRQAHEELRAEGVDARIPPIGVMVEVPSVIYLIPEFARRIDFFSIGTNDLTQYLLAVDRNNPRVAEHFDSLDPAVLRAIRQTVEAAHAAGKVVGVCGELASDPLAVLLLLAIGVDNLSMNTGSLLRTKWVVRRSHNARARELLEQALNLESAAQIRALLTTELEQHGMGGLVRAGR